MILPNERQSDTHPARCHCRVQPDSVRNGKDQRLGILEHCCYCRSADLESITLDGRETLSIRNRLRNR